MTGAGFDGPGAGGTDAERRVDQWAAQVAEKAQRYQDMQARVAEISITESSGDGAVRLTVGSSGVLTDLELTERAGQLQPRQLAAQIMETMRRAQGRLSGRVAEVMQSSVGDDTETVSAVVSSYQRRFPPPVEPDRPRRDRTDDEDGWDRPLLRE